MLTAAKKVLAILAELLSGVVKPEPEPEHKPAFMSARDAHRAATANSLVDRRRKGAEIAAAQKGHEKAVRAYLLPMVKMAMKKLPDRIPSAAKEGLFRVNELLFPIYVRSNDRAFYERFFQLANKQAVLRDVLDVMSPTIEMLRAAGYLVEHEQLSNDPRRLLESRILVSWGPRAPPSRFWFTL